MLTCQGGLWIGYLGAYGSSYFGGVVCRRDAPDCPPFVTAMLKDAVDTLKVADMIICVFLPKDGQGAYGCWEYKRFMGMGGR